MAEFDVEYGSVACEQVVVTTDMEYEEYELQEEPKAALSPSSKKRRGNLPKKSVEIMRQWLKQHMFHAYPSDKDKMYMARMGGLSPRQVCNWFINARRRYLPALFEKHGVSPDAQVMFRSRQATGGKEESNNTGSSLLRQMPTAMARRAIVRHQAGLAKRNKPQTVAEELQESNHIHPNRDSTDVGTDGYVSDASTKSALSDGMDFDDFNEEDFKSTHEVTHKTEKLTAIMANDNNNTVGKEQLSERLINDETTDKAEISPSLLAAVTMEREHQHQQPKRQAVVTSSSNLLQSVTHFVPQTHLSLANHRSIVLQPLHTVVGGTTILPVTTNALSQNANKRVLLTQPVQPVQLRNTALPLRHAGQPLILLAPTTAVSSSRAVRAVPKVQMPATVTSVATSASLKQVPAVSVKAARPATVSSATVSVSSPSTSTTTAATAPSSETPNSNSFMMLVDVANWIHEREVKGGSGAAAPDKKSASSTIRVEDELKAE